MKKNFTISAIIIINPEWFADIKQLPACLEALQWTDERLVVTSSMTDILLKIGKKYSARVVKQEGDNFAAWRNSAAHQAKGSWLLYVDADERVTADLRSEVESILRLPVTKYAAYAIPRLNIILGKAMRHGGWWPDYVIRLINKEKLIVWAGELHEQPRLQGELGYLQSYLEHHKHDRLEEMVEKTVNWSQTEAQLLWESQHPPMNVRRFLRPIFSELFSRLIIKRGIFDGTEGLIYGIYQSFSRFVTYSRLWEKQVANNRP